MPDYLFLNEVISAHRDMMSERYEYERVKSMYNLSPAFTEERAQALHDYLLEYIYPDQTKRQSINRAFDSLDDHIKHPGQLARIVIDSASLIFRYSRHLTQILKVGYKALLSYRAASRYERQLYKMAERSGLEPPITACDIKTVVALIPAKDIERLIDLNLDLLEILMDDALVQKTIEIIDELLVKMKKRPRVYAKEEMEAITVGRDIVVKARELFRLFDRGDQYQLIALIERIEKDELVSSDS